MSTHRELLEKSATFMILKEAASVAPQASQGLDLSQRIGDKLGDMNDTMTTLTDSAQSQLRGLPSTVAKPGFGGKVGDTMKQIFGNQESPIGMALTVLLGLGLGRGAGGRIGKYVGKSKAKAEIPTKTLMNPFKAKKHVNKIREGGRAGKTEGKNIGSILGILGGTAVGNEYDK